jgi:PAS domain-containing protein
MVAYDAASTACPNSPATGQHVDAHVMLLTPLPGTPLGEMLARIIGRQRSCFCLSQKGEDVPSTSGEPTSPRLALGRGEGDFDRLLDAVPDALVGVDRAGVIRYVNRRAQSLFGYERDDLVGQPIETLVPESVRPGHPAHREAYFAGSATRRPRPDPQGTSEQKPPASPRCLRGRRRDGTEFPLNLSLSRNNTEDGPLVIAAVHDLTDSQKANEKRDRMSRLAAMVEFSEDANISIGSDGMITSWNPAAERIYGYSSKEMIGKPGSFVTPDRAPR